MIIAKISLKNLKIDWNWKIKCWSSRLIQSCKKLVLLFYMSLIRKLMNNFHFKFQNLTLCSTRTTQTARLSPVNKQRIKRDSPRSLCQRSGPCVGPRGYPVEFLDGNFAVRPHSWRGSEQRPSQCGLSRRPHSTSSNIWTSASNYSQVQSFATWILWTLTYGLLLLCLNLSLIHKLSRKLHTGTIIAPLGQKYTGCY